MSVALVRRSECVPKKCGSRPIVATHLWTTPAVQDRICFDGRYGSHQSIRPLGGAVAPGHHGYPHAPVLDNSLASGAVVATRLQARQLDRSSISLILSREPRREAFSLRSDVSRPLRGFRREVWVIATLLGEHAPGDASKLVGQSHRQHIAMQALCGGLEPATKAVPDPTVAP